MSERPDPTPASPAVSDPFRFMADHASDAYFLVDADGRIAYANRAAHVERGHAPGELVGQPASVVNPAYPTSRVDTLFAAARAGNAFRLRHVHRRKDGTTFPVESSINFLELDGKPYLFSAVRDVTDQLRVDDDVRRQREHLEMIVRQADVGIFTCDFPLARLEWDAKLREHFFLTADEPVTIELFYERLHPDDREPARAALDRSLADRVAYDVNYRTVDPASGATRWINAVGRWHYDAAGAPTRIDGITIDVTRQVEAAAAVRDSERRFRQMADGAPVMIWVTEPDGTCTFLNERWYAFTGQTEAEALGIGWADATHPDDADAARDTFLAANAARGPFHIEYRLRGRDGSYRWFIDSAMPRFDEGGRYLGYIGSVIDIHDRKLAEQRVRESEQRLQLAVAIAGLGTFDIDLATDAVAVNDTGRAIYGWPADLAPTFAMLDAARHDDDRARARAAIAAAVEPGGTQRYELEQRIRRADGAERWVRVRGLALFEAGPDRPATRLVGTFLDVTDQRAAGERIRESEQRLQLALAIAELGTFEIDLETDAVIANDAGRGVYGWTPDEPLTFAFVQSFFHPEDRDRVVGTVAAALAPGGSGRFELEQRIVRRTGEVRWIRVRGTALADAASGRRRCVGTYLDVTDQVEAAARREQLLADAERARADAERASRLKDEFLTTLSHELRTPLNSILGWAHLLRRGDKSNDPSVAQGLDTIQRNARAQAQLIEDLLDVRALVGGTMRLKERRPIDLAQALREAADAVGPAALAKSIRVDVSVQPAIVNGDADRLRQVLWNLLNNAAKFTPKDGTVRATIRQEAGIAIVEVADTGQGIDVAFLPHVFDRFTMADASSTRRHGGLGLGLAIVKALVELHGGTVAARSDGPGTGATFVVTLPLA